MKNGIKPIYILLVILVVGAFTLINAYNRIAGNDEKVAAAWSEVVNQYQRRADLIPNLVNTVKGYTTHEREVLVELTNARAKVGSVQLTVDQLTDEAAVKRFQQAQQELSSALSRLIAVSENYPELKASELYSNLMTQLEGTENRIAVARGRYIESIQEYNSYIRRLPGMLLASFIGSQPKAQFTVENEKEISQAPQVSFD
ncbi:LemA family protein [Zophobihabitans entericus]|uniref:LemA family protein n=1 Tax=Zophobihabitans entericus TaxID=1635327 RepID=A0A6G9IDC6_9GAMM|nr:LemA family protein [Zophobihabitans entericus]QIQ22235.1 LemA family protein [Zophobihabitans entericus]